MNASQQTQPFPALDHSCKHAFPFRLACPSFVYPAGYLDNVEHLAPFVDEIELLFLESRFSNSLPSPGLIRELARLAGSGRITYHVHLPTDIGLGHRDAEARRSAVDVLSQLIDRCTPLNPTTYTLHLIRDPSQPDERRWQADSTVSLQTVLDRGLPGRMISVENLDDDIEQTAPVIDALDLSVCMDMGHLMAHGIDVARFYDRWKERITTAHLHGVAGAQDHLPLDQLSPAQMGTVMDVLKGFTGVVSLELFSFEALNASIKHLLDQRFIMQLDAGARIPGSP